MCNELKKARENANLTQKAMSELLKIPLRTISDWERGLRTPPEYVKLLIVEKLQDISSEKNAPKHK